MAGSLRDQLVQAGLATAAQAKKAERQARVEKQTQVQSNKGPGTGDPGTSNPGMSNPGMSKKKARQQSRQDPSAPANVKERARALNAEKSEKARALSRIANEKAAAKALRAQIKQIILQNDQRSKTRNDDDVPYNFVHGKKIKKIYIPRAQQLQLSGGSLVIVNNDGLYHLVSRDVAEQIRARDPGRIIAAHGDQAAEPTPDDDYYAKFKVPDDLDW
jgi:uncharacterized protein YaiL (DUF2058 family)